MSFLVGVSQFSHRQRPWFRKVMRMSDTTPFEFDVDVQFSSVDESESKCTSFGCERRTVTLSASHMISKSPSCGDGEACVRLHSSHHLWKARKCNRDRQTRPKWKSRIINTTGCAWATTSPPLGICRSREARRPGFATFLLLPHSRGSRSFLPGGPGPASPVHCYYPGQCRTCQEDHGGELWRDENQRPMPRLFVMLSRRHRTWPWTDCYYAAYWTTAVRSPPSPSR
jgi:hypothetical protein